MSEHEKIVENITEVLKYLRDRAVVAENNAITEKADFIVWLYDEIIKLLKYSEPRVLTLDEVLNAPDGTMVWVDELWNDENTPEQYALINDHTYENRYVILWFFDGSSSEESTHYYNERWRCWSSRPTEEQREAVKWQ